MIRIEEIEVFGFRAALRGMRNAMNSWNRADSTMVGNVADIGENDLDLCKRLIKSGASHRKFMRMLHVQMDVTAPLYWWKDYDTYKISTVANSCSTMHKIHAKEFTLKDFSTEHLNDSRGMNRILSVIDDLNYYRIKFLDSDLKDKDAWYSMIQLLPTSYMQKRTIDLNYETLYGLINDRKSHKLDEFRLLCVVLLTEVPYLRVFIEANKK